MNTAIYNGTSGLNSFQNAINVESNNISNISTVGFKSDRISFADLLYQSGVGKGTSMVDPIKDFSQGQIQETGIGYDFAIKGDGFFTVLDPQDNATYYTRAGNFQRSSTGMLVDINKMYVEGVIPVVSGDKITDEYTRRIATSLQEDATTLSSINTFATDYTVTTQSTGVSGNNLKTIADNISDIEAVGRAYQDALDAYEKNLVPGEPTTYAQNSVTFSPLETNDKGEYTLELIIDGVKYQQRYDTSIDNTLRLLSDQINSYTGITSSVDTSTGTLTIDSLIPGQSMGVVQAKLNDINMDVNTHMLAAGSGKNLVDETYAQFKRLVEAQGGKVATTVSTLTKTPTGTPPDVAPINLDLDQLGISDNMFGEILNKNGNLYLTQGDATFLVGKLSPVVFQSKESLAPQGNNLYTQTEQSGSPLFVAERSQVVNNQLEVSTTNLTESLVNLMTLQKAYDANSKSVTTADEMLKTAIELKK